MKITANNINNLYSFSILLLLLFSGYVQSQTPISLELAYEKALNKNLEIQGGKLKIDYQEKLKNSTSMVDPLSVSGEIGQFNSENTDNKITVAQSFRLPNFYKNQKQVLVEDLKWASLSADVQKWQLKKQLALVYNHLLYQDEKEKLLQKTDSIFSAYYQRAILRLKKGESNVLEKTTAENYRSQAAVQLKNLQKDRSFSLYQFNSIINENDLYSNDKGGYYSFKTINNTKEFSGNPLLIAQLEQQKNIEAAKLKAEKSKLSPSISLGINSMTMAGNGDGKRFQSAMVGIGIPLFSSAQKSVIAAQKINQNIAENNLQLGVRSMKNQYQSLITEHEKLTLEQEYYKNQGLTNAKTILKTANRLYIEGEINYLEWSILINQSLEIENKSIDNQKLLNETLIEINSWQGKL